MQRPTDDDTPAPAPAPSAARAASTGVRPRAWVKLLIVLLLLLLAGQFVLRGPWRGLHGGAEYAYIYSASRAWLDGAQPYNLDACIAQLADAGHPNPRQLDEGALYPPATLPVFATLAWMDWSAALPLWVGINLLATATLMLVLYHWLPTTLAPRPRALLALGLVLAWSPIHTAFFVGQLSILVAALISAGLLLVQRRRPGLAGVLIGVACAAKPQLALGFLVLLALGRYWKALLSGGLTLALLAILAVVRLNQTAPGWVAQFRANLAEASAGNGIVSAGPDATLRFQMLDLRPILFGLTDNATLVSAISFGLVLLAGGLAVARLLRLGIREHWLLAGAGVALLMLLPVYHRYYAAVILLPLIGWVAAYCVNTRRDRLGWVLALCLLPFAVPGTTMLWKLQQRGSLPGALTDTWLWTYGVLQHQTWCLLVILVLLLAWLYRRPLPVLARAGHDGEAA